MPQNAIPRHPDAMPVAEMSIRAATAAWSENMDGVWTWHPQPAAATHTYAPLADGGLTRRIGAIHEAGHAVAALRAGLGVDGVHLAPSSEEHMFHTVVSGDITSWTGYGAFLAAGERAADRWLRETGAWTPERAWSVERSARSDRAKAVSFAARTGRTFDFLAHPWDGWTQVCSWADGILEAHWALVTALADALTTDGELDARGVARMTGLPNPSTQ